MRNRPELEVYISRIAELEKENRILNRKLYRSENNRAMLEEALEGHIQALKVSNTELIKTQKSIMESEAKYRDMALYDPLTSLPTRILLQERLERAILHAERTHSPMAILFIDLDKFKEVNDRGGHDVGDIVLCNTASRLSACVRNSDTVARLGGDEFVILLETLRDKHEIVAIAKRVVTTVALPTIVSEISYFVGASIGISIFPQDGLSATQLIRNADMAMYNVKRTGKSAWKFYRDVLD